MFKKSEKMSEETVNAAKQRKYIFVVRDVECTAVSKKDISASLSVRHLSLFYLL